MRSSQQSKPKTCPTMLLVRRRLAACLAKTKSRPVLAPPNQNPTDQRKELGVWTRCWREFSMESQLKEVKKGGTPLLEKSDSLNVGGGVHDVYGEDEASMDRLVTPWSRNVASGVELLRDPRYNKGLGFTEEERDQHYLLGLLPPIHMTQDQQEQRILYNIRLYSDNLLKYVSIMELQERNERLFYKVLIDHVEEMMPIVYTPTVGEACQKYGLIFRRPHGLYISLKERGRILDVLKNWPEKDVRIIVVTDGERILGLGDLGLQGMGIPIGKLALYTALGGIRPSACLPVAIDVGTNNKKLLDDPFYIGLRRERATGQEYDDLVHEFMCAVKQEYGEKVLVQFEDFANHNAFKLLAKYVTTHLVFNDDIQGTAAVTIAGLLAACKHTKSKLSDQTFLFSGAGEAGTGIAEIIALKISREVNIPLEEARKKIWLTDSKGLIVKSRFDSLQTFKKPYAHEHEGCSELSHAVKILKPTVLIGTSAQAGIFTRDVLETMSSYTQKPIIMALSNPTSKAECTAEQAFTWTQGHALFASGSPFQPVTYNNKKFFTSQANNAYVFPGIGLGCMISGAIRMRDEMFLIAAEALASQVTEDHLEKGLLYPPWGSIRTVSAHVAAAVSAAAYDLGVGTRLPRPDDLFSYAKSCMYSPLYRQYR